MEPNTNNRQQNEKDDWDVSQDVDDIRPDTRIDEVWKMCPECGELYTDLTASAAQRGTRKIA